MTPEQAQAIARRIGMLGSSAGQGQWFEAQGLAVCTTPSLPDYLASGDRPLRVQKAHRISVECYQSRRTGECAWYASGPSVEFGDTPAEAILACAAAIETTRAEALPP